MPDMSFVPRMPLLADDENSSFRSTISTGLNNDSKKPSVSFKDEARVIGVLHLNDLTDEERHNYWHTRRECEIIIEMVGITVDLMNLGGKEDANTICFRGLEGKTREGRSLYTQAYQQLVEAVLYEQERHRNRRRCNTSKIAKISLRLTKECRKIAEQMGKRDELEASKYLVR